MSTRLQVWLADWRQEEIVEIPVGRRIWVCAEVLNRVRLGLGGTGPAQAAAA